MSIWTVKKRNETNEQLIKRFKKQTQNARVIVKVRNEKFNQKKKTKIRIRQEAIARYKNRLRSEREKLYD